MLWHNFKHISISPNIRSNSLSVLYDDENGCVNFKDEDEEELFNETYELEFDEQSLIVQKSIIPTIENITIIWGIVCVPNSKRKNFISNVEFIIRLITSPILISL